jgi:ribose 5-phosphate isomerase B
MKIGIASDHAGFKLKDYLLEVLPEICEGFEFIDYGTDSPDKSCDYPEIAFNCCEDLTNKKIDRCILICGSGIGMSIAANRIKGIRAALCHDIWGASLSRKHNDANVLCFGNWFVSYKMAEEISKIWLNTEFEGLRHLKRVEMLDS